MHPLTPLYDPFGSCYDKVPSVAVRIAEGGRQGGLPLTCGVDPLAWFGLELRGFAWICVGSQRIFMSGFSLFLRLDFKTGFLDFKTIFLDFKNGLFGFADLPGWIL